MAEFEELDCACAGLEGEGNPNIDPESIDVFVEVIRELHHKKKILDDRDCKTIRYSGARHYGCYFELTFALLAKPHEKVKTAIKVLAKAKNPVIDNLQIPQFLNVCADLHQLPNHEDVEEMKKRQDLELKERIIHVVCMKEFAAVKELADVMGTYGFSDEKDWLQVYVKLYEEKVLRDEDVHDLKKMITPFLQRIWKLFRSKDLDALRKAGDLFRRNASLKLPFSIVADIQESQYLSDKEYSSLFNHPATSPSELAKIAIAKDRDTSKGIAAVLQKHGYDDPSKTVIVLAELVAEECLSVEKGRDMIDVRSQIGREWIPMWSRAAAATTSEVNKRMAKILDAHGFTEEAVAVRRRETVGDPLPPPQPGHGTVGDPRPPPHPGSRNPSRIPPEPSDSDEIRRIIDSIAQAVSGNPPGPSTSAWIAAYEEALEKQGSVSVEVTRCLFIGPPAVGKSSLKHLLIHNKSKAVKISTRVMESPDVVRVTSEQYTVEGGSSSWKLLDGKAMIQSVQKTAIERKYQSVDDSPTQGVHLLVESGIPDTESMNIEKNRSDSNNMDSLAITDMKPIMEKEKVSKLEQAFADMHKEISAKDGITLDDVSFIHLLDSGGQPCFLDTLPLLLAVPCTYILVFNASQDLDQPFPVSYRADEKNETVLPPSQTGQELIRRMMSSFHTMGEKHSKDMSKEYGAQSPQLRIYLIGTFKDVLQRNEVLQQKCSEISNIIHRFRCLPSYNYIVEDGNSHPFFLINNNITADPKCSSEDLAYINYLRSSISQSRFALKMDVPLMWYLLQQVIHRAGQKLMRFTELRDFARNHQLRNYSLVASEQQFSSFVKLFTLLGFFVYFDFPETPDESKWVCTDATFFYSEVSKLLSIQFTKVFNLESRVFKQTGVIGPSPSSVLEELQISKDMDPEWLFKALVHTGIAGNIDGTCQKLFIPVALPLQDQPPYTTSVSVVCASFKFQSDAFTTEFISLPQGLYCRVIVKLANRRLWTLLPEESTCTSVKFLWRNSHILLMESADRLEVAVTFHESFLPCDDSMKVVHDYCCSVLNEVKTSMKKVADDIFGEQNPDIGDVVVGFRCPCDDKMPHLAIAVKDKNPSMRCVGGKMKGLYQKLSLDQMIWFAPLLQNQAKLTLQHSGDLKFYKLCCESEPSPFQSGNTPPPLTNPPGPQPTTGQDVIRSTEDFLPYVSKLEPYLTQLGTVLGIVDHTSAIVESPDNPNAKVLKILKHWIDVTPGCTWNLFYDNLGKSDVLKTVRQKIKEDYNITDSDMN